MSTANGFQQHAKRRLPWIQHASQAEANLTLLLKQKGNETLIASVAGRLKKGESHVAILSDLRFAGAAGNAYAAFYRKPDAKYADLGRELWGSEEEVDRAVREALGDGAWKAVVRWNRNPRTGQWDDLPPVHPEVPADN